MNGVIPSRFDRILNITLFAQKKKKKKLNPLRSLNYGGILLH